MSYADSDECGKELSIWKMLLRDRAMLRLVDSSQLIAVPKNTAGRGSETPTTVAFAFFFVLYNHGIKVLVAAPLEIRIADTKIRSSYE